MIIQLKIACLLCLLCAVLSRCPNSCSGHGLCGTSNICTCFDGWTGGAPDCSARTCPNGTAWADKAYAIDQAHQLAECSNAGVCNRVTGVCNCFAGFTGAACQRSACPNDCSGHGTCSSIKDVALYSGPDYDATVENAGDGIGYAYNNWDKNSIQLCECDGGYFGADCSQVMCPKGDDPLTINQNYRQLDLLILCSGSDELQGRIGLEFMGETVFIDLTNPSSEKCTESMAFNGFFGNVACSLTSLGNFQIGFSFIFYSWPTFPCDNNLYSNDGNPSKYEFYCDVTQVSPFTYCEFTDVVANNVREYAYCSNRGICDFNTGICDCMEGFGGPACANATYLYTQGSNAVPGLKINVNGYDYTSSALQITSDKAKASDFNLIEAIAGSETVFYVQGDGTVGINKLKTLSGGQTVSGSGLYVESGGVTVVGDGLYAYNLDASDPVLTVGSKYTGALGSSYAAIKVTTDGSNPNTHYFIQGYNDGRSRFGVRGDGAVMIKGGGLYVTSGASIFSGGLTVSYGLSVHTGGLRVSASGASITGGLTVGSGGMLAYGGLQLNGGASVYSGGLKVVGGASLTSGGVYITGGVTIGVGGLSVTEGLTVGSGGVLVTQSGLTVTNGGIYIGAKGLTVNSDGVVVTNRGVTIQSGGLFLTGGLTVAVGGLVNTGGLTVSSGGGFITTGGLTVRFGGMLLSGGMTVNIGGLQVSGGATIMDSGLLVSGGLSVRNALYVQNALAVTGGMTLWSGAMYASGGLTVNGNALISSSAVISSNLFVNGAMLVTGGMTVYAGNYLQSNSVIFSDRRLKSNLAPIKEALNKVRKLNGVYFKWIQDEPTGLNFDTERHVGVIAQDVLEVMPEVVEEKHSGKYLGVDYAALVPLLIEAIHDLDELVADSKESSPSLAESDEINDLKTDVQKLQHENVELTKQLNELRDNVNEMKKQIATLSDKSTSALRSEPTDEMIFGVRDLVGHLLRRIF